MDLNKTGAAVAIAAVTLMLAGASLPQTASADNNIVGRCFGVNACKGQGACKMNNDCKGKNACKGQGFVEGSQADCDLKKGTFKSGS